MRILDRYIIFKIIAAYFVILFSFLGLHIIIELFTNLSHILESKPPLHAIISYYIYALPLMFLRINPFSLLISAIYALGELNKHNEIISIRASGISILRISLIVISFPLLVSFFSLFLQEKVLINSQRKIEEIKITSFQKGLDSNSGEEKNVSFKSGDLLFFIGVFSPHTNTLKNVYILQEDEEGNTIKTMECEKVIYEQGIWRGYGVVESHFDDKENVMGKPIYWEEKEIALNEKPKNLTLKRSKFIQFYTLKMLKGQIDILKETKAYRKLSEKIIDYHRKITEPFTGIFLIIGALPFALEIKKRKVGLSSLGLGFIFGFIYYTLSSISIAFGEVGIIIPFLSPWIAPVFFITVGVIGIFLLR